MADSRRTRENYEKSKHNKWVLALVSFLLVGLILISSTFLNPFFMKKEITTGSNQDLVTNKFNVNFTTLAKITGAQVDVDQGAALSNKQANQLANQIIDYSLGFHGYRSEKLSLAGQILDDIRVNTDENSPEMAQKVVEKLNMHHNGTRYFIIDAFNINFINLVANVSLFLLIANIVLIILLAISLFSLLKEMKRQLSTKKFIHILGASGMWAGFFLIIISGLLALMPVIFNVTQIAIWGFLIQLSSSIFLGNVIIGVILYVICAVLWQLTGK